MRIVQLADLYAPVVGGSERHVLNLAQELAGRGHESVVVTIGGAGLPRFEIDDKGVRVYRLRSGLTARMDRLFSDPERRYLPGHPDADADGYVAFPHINPAEDMVDLMGASRNYEANVAAIGAVKDMIQKSIDLLH